MANGRVVHNTLLLRLPDEEFETLQPHLKYMPFTLAACLQREHEPIANVFFMNEGIASMLVETDDGRSVEVGVSGREDMIGLLLTAGLNSYPHSVIVQVPGDGFRIDSNTIRNAIANLPEFRRMLVRLLGIRSVQFAQNAACNRLHNVRQRLARWLLVTHDRLESDTVATTHDFLSKMIGTDRPTVSVAIADLEREGIVARSRGSIQIVNRAGLEQLSCRCYAAYQQFNAELGLQR